MSTINALVDASRASDIASSNLRNARLQWWKETVEKLDDHKIFVKDFSVALDQERQFLIIHYICDGDDKDVAPNSDFIGEAIDVYEKRSIMSINKMPTVGPLRFFVQLLQNELPDSFAMSLKNYKTQAIKLLRQHMEDANSCCDGKRLTLREMYESKD